MSEAVKNIAELSPESLDLLMKKMAENSANTGAPALRAGALQTPQPLSFPQQRLWFLDQLKPGNDAFNIPTAIRFQGALNLQALEFALSEITRRHTVLRTVIQTNGAEPVQVVMPHARVTIPVITLEENGEITPHVRELMATETRKPFDLAVGPLFRVSVFRLGQFDHILLLLMHHIVSDAWSVSILLKDLVTYYHAFANQQPATVEDLPIQYADFARWQRAWLQGDRLSGLLEYWKDRLKGAPALLELPSDRPRPGVQSLRGATARFCVPAELSHLLRRFSQQHQSTLFMTLLAGFKALLFRYTHQTDLVVGTPVANRNQVELEKLIGFFINTLVLRTEVNGEISFLDLLKRVRTVALDAYAHQELPFEKLVEALHMERSLSHTPIVQIFFGLNNVPPATLVMEGLRITEVESQITTSKHDLIFSMFDDGAELQGVIEYSTDLFDAQTIARMSGHFINLLAAAANDPDRPISRLRLLSEDEQQQLLAEERAATRTSWAPYCLHEIFSQTAVRHSNKAALSFGGKDIRYRELDRRANQLANYLRSKGVGAEDVVGLTLRRSTEMLVAVLAVLKAGAAYLPMEPDLPVERLDFMVKDSSARVLITTDAERKTLSGFKGQVVSLDGDAAEIDAESCNPVPNIASPDNAAYVIYTSGSTGQPKGVVMSHASVVRLLSANEPWYGFNEQDVWPFFHSYAFDVSVWEIWGSLLYGGRLIIVPYGVTRTPDEMLELICREKITVLNQTPSAFRQLMEAATRAGKTEKMPLDLRLVIFAGEVLDYHSLQPWCDLYGDDMPKLINKYGITETCVHVTYRRVTAGEINRGDKSCIGVPIPDLQLYILDENLQQTPVGIPGEICVGGPGLARCYLNRPALTAERFVPNPFGKPGERIYRSGDLARYLNSFDIEYLGRLDHQVKIRGFRVELGEIETLLSHHPAIKHVLVMARDDAGGQRLVAYVVPQDNQEVSSGELRDYLKRRLPQYMLPASFVMLAHMPLTGNGKVDRRALPAPGSERPNIDQPFVGPRSPAEEVLAHIFCEVLGLDQAGVNDNFFALGGDSIRSVRVLAMAKERGLQFSLEQLFSHPTIAELSLIATGAGENAGPATQQPLKSQPFDLIAEADRSKMQEHASTLDDAYPLTVGQAGLFYHVLMAPGAPVYHNVDSMCFRASRFELEMFQQAVDRVVARHPILRTAFDLNSFSEPLQLVHRSAHLSVQFQDLREQMHDEQQAVLRSYFEEEKRHPFDLAAPPLLRFQVHLLSEEIFQLTQTEFHAIHDGWSMNSMLVEIFQDYAELLAGRMPALRPQLASSFRDFVVLEREAVESKQAQDFWDSQLSECEPLRLSIDSPETVDREETHIAAESRLKAVPISTETCRKLEQMARRAAVPLKSVLMAAHLKVLSLITGQNDVLTGMVSHGRPDQEGGEDVRGFFLNTLPFRQKLQSETWMDLVRETFRTEMNMLPYRRFPLGALQKKWGKAASLSTVFNFINFHVLEKLEVAGVELLGIPYGINQTHFALSASFNRNKSYWGAAFPDADLVIALEYDEGRLNPGFAEVAAEFYRRVLEQMAENPQARHVAQSFVPTSHERLLREWNNTDRAADFRPVHQEIEHWARRTPDAIAVRGEKVQLTYGELNRAANRLARSLQQAGAGHEKVVGVLLERSPEMIVALLAVLKSGAAYLPLEQMLPRDRMLFALRDAKAIAVITTLSLAELIKDTDAAVITMDHDAARIANQEANDICIGVDPRQLAYVIYTSGSTGSPKGVAIEHRGMANLTRWYRAEFAISQSDAITQIASPVFDATVLEIWPCLTAGASLFIPDAGTRATPTKLSQWLADEAISVTFLPTILAEDLMGRKLPSHSRLRILNTGGDKLNRGLSKQLPFVVNNLYGPTENSVVATSARVDCSDRRGAPPIGRPLENVQVHITDTYLQLLTIGVPGELCISGVSLARGYIGRPDLTAEKFLPDPFSTRPGERIYKTGDLARFGADGQVEFLGRLDNQVKVRGFRIELGEIEAALQQHTALKDVVVTAPQLDGERVLVAYFVPRAEAPNVSELRSYLRKRFPEYMVPAAYVQVESFPLTRSGKIDRAALPRPHRSGVDAATAIEMPRSESERRIAAVWREVLQVEQVGVHDNFFDLGGNSVRMIQIHARLQAEFARGASPQEISMMDLFHYPTVSALAQRLSDLHPAETVVAGMKHDDERRQFLEQRQALRKHRV